MAQVWAAGRVSLTKWAYSHGVGLGGSQLISSLDSGHLSYAP
jgi:hypothetical protein